MLQISFKSVTCFQKTYIVQMRFLIFLLLRNKEIAPIEYDF